MAERQTDGGMEKISNWFPPHFHRPMLIHHDPSYSRPQLISGLSREVKSSNIIWNPVNGSPKLYDFRSRERWSGEMQKIERIGDSCWSPQCWAHWSKTQISLLYFYFFIFLGTEWANLVFIPKYVILYCSVTGNPVKHPFESMVSSILTERIHIHCLWRSSLLGPGMNLKTDEKRKRKHTRTLRTEMKNDS